MEAIVIWSAIHEAVAVNEWHGSISTKINKSGPHCGTQDMESLKHMFLSCPMTQQVWHYVANIMWQFFAKRGNLGLREYISMMQCHFDQPLCKTL